MRVDPAAVWSKRSKLKPWKGNPRKNTRTIRRVARSIKRFGWGAVVLARERNGEIVAGHTRVAAADQLEQEWRDASPSTRKRWKGKGKNRWHPDAIRVATKREVPVRLGAWSEKEAHLLSIADNRIPEESEWDDPALAEILKVYSEEDRDDAGFEEQEIARLLSFNDDGGSGEGDGPGGDAPPPGGEGDGGADSGGDGSGFVRLTYTLTTHQAETVRAALSETSGVALPEHTDNEDQDGNALFTLAVSYLNQGGA